MEGKDTYISPVIEEIDIDESISFGIAEDFSDFP
jgi:hypothetical protein